MPKCRFCLISGDVKTRRILAVSGYFAVVFCLPYLFDELASILLLPSGLAFLWLIFFLRDPSGRHSLNEEVAMKPVTLGQPTQIAVGLLLALLLSAAAAKCTILGLDYLGIPYQEKQDLVQILKRSGWTEKLIVGVITAILAPAGEEIVFRKIIFSWLQPAGTVTAVILTSALFGVLHFHLAGVLALAIFGVVLQILFLKTRNLWCTIQVHMAFNLLTFIGAIRET